MNTPFQSIDGFDLPIHFAGPELTEGPLPAIFYFTSTARESLTVDPFNQPVNFLSDQKLRIFSLTLPGHGLGTENTHAFMHWANSLASGHDIITRFVHQCSLALDFLLEKEYIQPDQIAAAGLSRGAFIAFHFASQDPRVKTILGFSPLTQLDQSSYFKELENHPVVKSLSVDTLIPTLARCKIRCYIGNRDTLVGTENCFHFIQGLTEEAFQHKNRSLPIELIIYPSIGHKGHGTPPHIFRDGTDWLKTQLAS